jgi:hypothetical protein
VQARAVATHKKGFVEALQMGNWAVASARRKMPHLGLLQTLKRRRCRGKMGVAAMCKASWRRSKPGSAVFLVG